MHVPSGHPARIGDLSCSGGLPSKVPAPAYHRTGGDGREGRVIGDGRDTRVTWVGRVIRVGRVAWVSRVGRVVPVARVCADAWDSLVIAGAT